MSSLKLSFAFPCIFPWPGETSLRTTRRRTRPNHASLGRIVAAGGEVGAQTVDAKGAPPVSMRSSVVSRSPSEGSVTAPQRGRGRARAAGVHRYTAKVCDDPTKVRGGGRESATHREGRRLSQKISLTVLVSSSSLTHKRHRTPNSIHHDLTMGPRPVSIAQKGRLPPIVVQQSRRRQDRVDPRRLPRSGARAVDCWRTVGRRRG
jgi:hypothetical protein